MIAVAWFSAGIIAPFFTETKNNIKTLTVGVFALLTSLVFLMWAMRIVRRINL